MKEGPLIFLEKKCEQNGEIMTTSKLLCEVNGSSIPKMYNCSVVIIYTNIHTMCGEEVLYDIVFTIVKYTCIKRSHLGQRKSGIMTGDDIDRFDCTCRLPCLIFLIDKEVTVISLMHSVIDFSSGPVAHGQ